MSRADQVELVRELGVKDSKLLTDDLMRKIAPDLQATLIYSVLTLKNEKYNEVQARGWSQGKIKALLHNQALKHVLRKMDGEKPDYILIDQFAERGIYYNHIKAESEIVRENVLFSTKAEGLACIRRSGVHHCTCCVFRRDGPVELDCRHDSPERRRT